MWEVTNWCFWLHGGVESVDSKFSEVEIMLRNLWIDDLDAQNKILRELKIITREVTGYLSESTFPSVGDKNFCWRARSIMNGIKDMVIDNAA